MVNVNGFLQVSCANKQNNKHFRGTIVHSFPADTFLFIFNLHLKELSQVISGITAFGTAYKCPVVVFLVSYVNTEANSPHHLEIRKPSRLTHNLCKLYEYLKSQLESFDTRKR